ncbi:MULTISPECIES: hypothetical protein [unclassified Granulicatella]|uniref:hypothetical protein n=1 Tax=unclassified Granulicatella TaxID=2630493 RepID=UPI0010749727|nr:MULTISPECIES: hypothetical protein [unclassified Granulicatella]MBF0779794.1 hypothetical protein [Granulicatella sp. 19428wC4_WM01]TFU96196.1 hypothetical protein E4T68_01680 [Granulicatella sp. WM01]
MISIKSEIFTELSRVLQSLHIKVYDYYPDEIEQFPLVVYLEENNIPHEIIDNQEVTCELTYRVDIWSNASDSEVITAINAVFTKFGFRRLLCSDVPNVSGLKQKIIKFTGIVDKTTKLVHNN